MEQDSNILGGHKNTIETLIDSQASQAHWS